MGLYIHIPFCERKCDYCDFLSGPYTETGVDTYLNALESEASLYKEQYGKLPLSSVFIGGGTPTIMTPAQIEKLGQIIHSFFDLSRLLEFSFEANPESLTLERARAFKTIGANRVSMGLQTAENALLKTIGRIHSYERFEESWNILEKTQFNNKNIDVMIGLPGQTEAGYKASFLEILSKKPDHISAYGLILEEGTPMEIQVSKGLLTLPEESLERSLYHWTKSCLEEHGYIHYEISNWALPNKECLHNLGYWQSESYVALGIGAHGFLNSTRYENPDQLDVYYETLQQNRLPWVYSELVTPFEAVKETIMLQLRLIEGIDLNAFYEKHRLAFKPIFQRAIQKGIIKGWLELTSSHLRLTSLGLDYCNAAILLLFEELEGFENEFGDHNYGENT